jgi:[ribosomal protein S5]-alanine N-acetyltransferase
MEHPPEILKTKRLALRRPRASDADAIFRAYATDPDVTRFLIWKVHESVAETTHFLEGCDARWNSGESYPYAIGLLPDAAEPFGMIEGRPGKHGIDFGYALARAEWGNGYMAEALAALADWWLDQPSVYRVSAFCDVENLASARVIEKAGMQFEGLLRRYNVHPNISAEPRDVLIFAKARR